MTTIGENSFIRPRAQPHPPGGPATVTTMWGDKRRAPAEEALDGERVLDLWFVEGGDVLVLTSKRLIRGSLRLDSGSSIPLDGVYRATSTPDGVVAVTSRDGTEQRFRLSRTDKVKQANEGVVSGLISAANRILRHTDSNGLARFFREFPDLPDSPLRAEYGLFSSNGRAMELLPNSIDSMRERLELVRGIHSTEGAPYPSMLVRSTYLRSELEVSDIRAACWSARPVVNLLLQQLRELRLNWVQRSYLWHSDSGQDAWEMGVGQMVSAAARNAAVLWEGLNLDGPDCLPDRVNLEVSSRELAAALAHAHSMALGAGHLPEVYSLLHSLSDVAQLLVASVVEQIRKKGAVELDQPKQEQLRQTIRLHWDSDQKPRGLRAVIYAVDADVRSADQLRGALVAAIKPLQSRMEQFANGSAHIVEREAARHWSVSLNDYFRAVDQRDFGSGARQLARSIASTQIATKSRLATHHYADEGSFPTLQPDEDWHRRVFGHEAQSLADAPTDDEMRARPHWRYGRPYRLTSGKPATRSGHSSIGSPHSSGAVPH